ncbi:MAG: tetratricopeptide repeat protein [Planctomycetes bacterium]|nr:tetratricopeptide repeat protein [Planctomycetota bacterium]
MGRLVREALAGAILALTAVAAPAGEKAATDQAGDAELSGFSTFLVNNAYMALRDGKLDDAHSFIARALETQPNNARLLGIMAEILERQEKWPEADQYLSRLLVHRPADGNALARRGFVRMHLDRRDEAREDFTLALKHDPDPEVRTNVEAQLVYLGPLRPTATDLAAASERSTTGTTDKAGTTESAGLAERAEGSDAVDATVATVAEELERLQQARDWPALERRYGQLLEDHPDDFHYRSGRGFARLHLRRFADAQEDFAAALPRAPDAEARQTVSAALAQAEAEERLAQATERQRRRTELRAREDWEALERELTAEIAADPDNPTLVADRGFARLQRRRYAAAREDFQAALAKAPTPESRRTIEAALTQIDQEEHQERLASRQRHWNDLREREQWAELERSLTETLEDQPGNATLLADRGFTRVHLRRYREAQEDFRAALALDPDPEARQTLEAAVRQVDAELDERERQQLATARARVQERIQGWQEAADDDALAVYLDEVITLDPDNAFAWASRGYLHSRREEFEAAQRDFERAIEVDPDSDVATGAREALENLEKERLARLPKPPGPAEKLEQVAKAIADKEYAQAQEQLDALAGEELEPADRAALTFYRAELLWVEEKFDAAYPLFEAALPDLATEFLQSECLWRMADYNRKGENQELAMRYAHRSAALLPDNEVRNSEVGYLFLAYKQDKEAIYYFERALRTMHPTLDQAGIYMDLGYAYKREGDNQSLHYNLHRYIDCMTVKLERQGTETLRKDVESTYGARREHADLIRRWGLYSGLYTYRRDNGDYAVQQINDLYWQPYFNNGRYVQAYVQTIGTLSAKYSGRVFEPLTSTYNDFYSSAHWRESFHTLVGIRVDPFTSVNATFALEKIFKIGRHTNDDVRVRAAHSWDTGLEYEPCARNWLYATTFNEATYSLQHDNLTFVGEARLGRSFRADPINPRLVVSPYVGPYYGYQGRGVRKSERYFAEAGPGLHFRKWYREDKYNAPQSYMDVIVQYRVGLTNRRENILVMNIFHSF